MPNFSVVYRGHTVRHHTRALTRRCEAAQAKDLQPAFLAGSQTGEVVVEQQFSLNDCEYMKIIYVNSG